MCVNLYKVYVSGMVRLLPEIAQIDLFTKKPPPPMPRLGAGKHVSNVSPCLEKRNQYLEREALSFYLILESLTYRFMLPTPPINEGLACYEVMSQ